MAPDGAHMPDDGEVALDELVEMGYDRGPAAAALKLSGSVRGAAELCDDWAQASSPGSGRQAVLPPGGEADSGRDAADTLGPSWGAHEESHSGSSAGWALHEPEPDPVPPQQMQVSRAERLAQDIAVSTMSFRKNCDFLGMCRPLPYK